VVPSFERFERWSDDDMRQDGQPVAIGSFDASPFHWMQRDLSDPTQFFIHYRDHYAEMSGLAERIGALLDKVLTVLKQSPAEVVWWGANFDDMLTYPPYFEKEIQPWIRKTAETLGAAGKLVLVHTDGENTGLMDLIRDSGAHVAESITPAPLTRLPFSEYYRRWSPHLTLFGGIPSTMLLPGTSEADFEAHVDGFFRAIAPGARMVVGVADEVPPEAVFSRLQRLGERLEREGRLPIEAGAFRPAPAAVAAAKPAEPPTEAANADQTFAAVHEAVITGKHVAIKEHVQALLDRGVDASAILDQGLIAAITVVGNRMAAGTAFIPHVLLAARAMAAGMSVLEPHLMAGGGRMRGRILIGTVAGDMHDIGKNLVATLLRGEGFEIRDLGINVSRQTFCDEVAAFRPHVVGLSALLTTTMMEMQAVIGALDERQLRTHRKVIVGGAPVSEPFARQIGADGYAANAVEAVQLAKRLIAEVARYEA
jgi:methanogenic corrinoid protein MtbC1